MVLYSKMDQTPLNCIKLHVDGAKDGTGSAIGVWKETLETKLLLDFLKVLIY